MVKKSWNNLRFCFTLCSTSLKEVYWTERSDSLVQVYIDTYWLLWLQKYNMSNGKSNLSSAIFSLTKSVKNEVLFVLKTIKYKHRQFYGKITTLAKFFTHQECFFVLNQVLNTGTSIEKALPSAKLCDKIQFLKIRLTVSSLNQTSILKFELY